VVEITPSMRQVKHANSKEVHSDKMILYTVGIKLPGPRDLDR